MSTLQQQKPAFADYVGADLPKGGSALVDAIEQLPVGMFVCEFDSVGNPPIIKYHNPQVAELFGVSRDELILDSSVILRLSPCEDLVRLRTALINAIKTGGGCRAEIRIQRTDLSRWIEIRAVVRIQSENLYSVSACCWDITARKNDELAAAERQNRENGQLRLQSESLPIGLIISAADDDLTITEWNPAAEKIFGYSRDEAIGKSGLKLLVSERNLPFVRNEVRLSDNSKQARTSTVGNVHKDGHEIWCRWVNTQIFDANGKATATMAMVQDITRQLQNEASLRLWASVIQQSTDGIMICDISKRIILVNKAFEEITGFAEADAIGNTPRILQSGRQDRDFYAQMWKSVTETGQWRGEIWNRRKSGEIYVEWLSLTAVLDDAGGVTHYMGIFSDITLRKQTEERVHHLAHFDALTELPNRSLLIDRAGQLLEVARRSRKKIGLLFIDLDRFKNINDSMGHEAGDELLKVIGKRLAEIVRAEDTVARMGGDEFIVVLAQIDDVNDVAAVAQNVLSAINAPMTIASQELSISGSVGICIFPNDALDVSEMIRNADAAMYRAKSSGRNTYQFYTREMNERALEILATETALRQALEHKEFVLHYQPQVDVESGAIVGTEALIRWNRPGVGLVMPAQFIPIAEERGLIAALGEWTLQEASRQAAAWDSQGMRPLPIAINLSATEFHQPGFVARVQDTIRSQGLRAERIELEITEGVIVQDAQTTIEILKSLSDFGVQLSIDDFGTGYSSLNYLRRFPIHKIKIDQSFVRDMLEDNGAAGIVLGIIGLAKSLQLKVIAEGVETEEQLAFLKEAQCDFAQGYLFSRALPVEEFEKFVAQ